MSVEIWGFLPAMQLPNRNQLQAAIHTHGHRMALEEPSTSNHGGFVPLELNGIPAGFEYYNEAISDVIDNPEDDDPELIAAVEHCDRVDQLKTHGGRKADLLAAIVTAVALTRHADGIFFDPQSGEFAGQGEVLEVAALDS